jgi:hypothetical protein
MITICPEVDEMIDLTNNGAFISGSVNDGTWSGGFGLFDANGFTTGSTYQISQQDIDAGGITLTLSSDIPTDPECDPSQDELIISFFQAPSDLEIIETYCSQSGESYTSPDGIVYDENTPTGTEQLINQNGCSYTLDVDLDFIDLPNINIVNVDCSSDMTTYTVSYVMLTGQIDDVSIGNDNGSTITDIPLGTNVTLTISNNGQCSEMLDVQSPNCDCPNIDPPLSGGDVTICANDPIPQLNVVSPSNLTVNWYSDPDRQDYLIIGDFWTPSDAGTFYVESIDIITGCVSSSLTTVTLTILDLPSFETNTVCAVDGQTYDVEVTILDGGNYTIISTEGTVDQIGSDSYLISGIDINNNVDIVVDYLDITCSSETTITPPNCDCPAIDPPMSSGNSVICDDDSLPELSVNVDPGLVAYWYTDPSLYTLIATGNSFTPTQPGVYYIVLVDENSGCASESISVELIAADTPILTISELVCNDGLLTYNVLFTVTGNLPSVSSNVGNVNFIGSQQYIAENIPIDQSITINFSDELGNCEDSITLNPPNCDCPAIVIPMLASQDSYCEGSEIPELELLSIFPDISFEWYADEDLSILLSNSSEFIPPSSGIYYVIAVDSDGCTSLPLEVLVSGLTVPVIDVIAYECSVTIDDTYFVEIQLSENEVISSQINATVNNSSNASETSIITAINGTEPLAFQILSLSTGCTTDIEFEPLDCDCPANTNTKIALSSDIICGDETVDGLILDFGDYVNYTWTSDGDGVFGNTIVETTMYTPGLLDIQSGVVVLTVIFEDIDGDGPCQEKEESITLTINPTPEPPTIPNNIITYCFNEMTSELAASGNDLTWFIDNTMIQGGPPIPDSSIPGTTTYSVLQTIDGCNSEMSMIDVTVYGFEIDYAINSNCNNDDAAGLIINEVEDAIGQFTLVAQGEIHSFTLSDLPFVIDYPYDETVSFDVTTEINGCTYSFESENTITDPGDYFVNISSDDLGENTYELGYSTNLDGSIETIIWESVVELTCENCSNPSISITENTNVELTLINVEGCEINTTIQLEFIARDLPVFLPNIFSPMDEDAGFYPQSGDENILVAKFEVYDRWGNKVHSAQNGIVNDPSIAWDGMYSGSPVEQGVYVYVLELTLPDGSNKILRAGDITIIR